MAEMVIPGAVTIREIGPASALPGRRNVLSAADEIRLLEMLSRAGLRRIEVPVDSEVLCGAELPDDVSVAVPVADQRDLEGVLDLVPAIDEIRVTVWATEAQHQWSTKQSLSASLREIDSVVSHGRDAGLRAVATIINAFVCPAGGHVPPEAVMDIGLELAEAGVSEISFSDGLGAAEPSAIDEFLRLAHATLPQIAIAARFHEAGPRSLINVLAALGAGCQSFDASLSAYSGPGGRAARPACVPTEHLVSLLGQLGVSTGIETQLLADVAQTAEQLIDRAG